MATPLKLVMLALCSSGLVENKAGRHLLYNGGVRKLNE